MVSSSPGLGPLPMAQLAAMPQFFRALLSADSSGQLLQPGNLLIPGQNGQLTAGAAFQFPPGLGLLNIQTLNQGLFLLYTLFLPKIRNLKKNSVVPNKLPVHK